MQSNPAVSNISTAAQRSFLWAPYRLNKLPKMSFKFPINLMGKYNNGFLDEAIMVCAQILVHRWGPEQ